MINNNNRARRPVSFRRQLARSSAWAMVWLTAAFAAIIVRAAIYGPSILMWQLGMV